MMALVTFFAECIGLFLLSGWLTQTIYSTIARISRSQRIAMSVTTALLFPGTVIHELSHLFVAEIMGVKTGTLTLVPEGLEDQEIQAGSVAVAKTDPFRRTIIGVAPVIVGMGAITAISYMSNMIDMTYMMKTIQYYLLFVISNSMFSSKEDMKGVIPVVATLGILLAAGFLVGFRFSLTGQAEVLVLRVLDSLTKSLGLVLAVNGAILLGLKVLLVMIGGRRRMLPGG